MILVCPECTTNYELPVELPAGGAKVRCSSCAHVWKATEKDLLQPEPEEEPEVEASEPEADDSVEEVAIEATSPIEDDSLDALDFEENDDEEDLNSQNDIDSLFDVEPEDDADEDNSQDDIDGLFDEPDDAGEDNSQDDIDGLFDEPEGAGEDNSQDDIDGLFDVTADSEPDEDNSQDDIDGLFDEPDAGEENSQDDVDGLFDVTADMEPEAEVVSAADEAEDMGDPFATVDDEVVEKEEEVVPVQPPFWQRLDQKTIVGWACYVIIVGVLLVFMTSARVQVVHVAPAMASVYKSFGLPVNVRGVMFINVRQRWEPSGDKLALHIEGEIANLTNKYKQVPHIIVSALSDDGREVFRWVVNARKKPLLPGEKAPFVSIMPAPPKLAKHILIRFE